MSVNPPEPPPYGALIEDAREKAGLSAREAARRAGISDAWWRYLARGYQKAPGDLSARADTLARMARVVGITPELLESEGERPDAAEVLRELLRTPPEPPAERRLAAVPAPGALPDDPSDEEVERLILAEEPFTRRDMLWKAWRLMGADRRTRLELLRVLLAPPPDVREVREEWRDTGLNQSLTAP